MRARPLRIVVALGIVASCAGAPGVAAEEPVAGDGAATEEPVAGDGAATGEAEVRTALAEGDRLLFAGEPAAAREPYERALRLLPRDQQPQVLKQLARIDYESGDRRAAVARLEESLTIAPEDADALREMVSLLAEQGRVAEARAYAQRLPERVTVDAEASINLGFALQRRGDVRGANAQFSRAIHDHPDAVDAYYYRSQTALALGDRATALSDSRALVELAPGHPKAAEARALIAALSHP